MHVKTKQKTLIVLAAIVCSLLLYLYIDRDAMRNILQLDGRYSDIAKMEKLFKNGQYKSFPSGFKHAYNDGSWIYVLATDSHHGGGTIGVLESSGKTHYYFGHVCGLGEGVGISLGTNAFDPNQSHSIYTKIK